MAGNLYTAFADRLAKYAFSDSAVTRPNQWFVRLFTATPSNAGGGVEVSDAGYTQQEVTFDAAGKLSTADITFGPAATGFGLVAYADIVDQNGAGLAWAALSTAQTIPSGARLTLTAGEVSALFT